MPRLPALLAVFLAAVLYAAPPVEPPLWPAEAHEATLARDVAIRGPLHVPAFAGVPQLAKPPLASWLAAPAAAPGAEVGHGPAPATTTGTAFLAGASAAPSHGRLFALRLPARLAALGMALTTFLLGRGWFSAVHGVAAALLVLLAPLVLLEGRALGADPMLACFVTIAVGSAITAYRAVSGRRFLGFLLCAGLGVGLGFLAKGAIAAVLALLTMTAVVIADRGPRGLLTLRALAILAASLLFLAPAVLLWGWLLWRDGGGEAIRGYLEGVRDRVAGHGAEPHAWWFYGAAGALGFLPWTVFLPFAGRGREHHLAPGGHPEFPLRHLVVWAVLPVLLLSLVGDRREAYLLPIVPPLALLAASALLEPPREGRAARACAAIREATSALLLLLGPAVPLGAALGRLADGRPGWLPGLALFAIAAAAIRGSAVPKEDAEAARGAALLRDLALAAVLAVAFAIYVEPAILFAR